MQLWPPVVDPSTLRRQVWDAETARSLPGISRILSLYGGLISQMPLSAVRGTDTLPTPRFLQQPDPELVVSTFVSSHVEDYWLHGNAIHLVTVRDAYGYPAAVRYFPASWWQIWQDPTTSETHYFLQGRHVPIENVVHIQRGTDPAAPGRGVGIVEQHLRTLDRAGLQEEYERNTLRGSGVPSVAVIAPQDKISQTEADELGDEWDKRFNGPVRRPGIFPHGTEIKPLSWSPEDQQLVLARQLTATDLANLANLDPYWLGAPGSSHTYRSAGSMFVALLRTALEPVLRPIEQTWSDRWFPYGRHVRFDRVGLTRDDLATMVATGATAVNNGLMSVNEWRAMQGLPPFDTPDADEPRKVGASAAGQSVPALEQQDDAEPVEPQEEVNT